MPRSKSGKLTRMVYTTYRGTKNWIFAGAFQTDAEGRCYLRTIRTRVLDSNPRTGPAARLRGDSLRRGNQCR